MVGGLSPSVIARQHFYRRAPPSDLQRGRMSGPSSSAVLLLSPLFTSCEPHQGYHLLRASPGLRAPMRKLQFSFLFCPQMDVFAKKWTPPLASTRLAWVRSQKLRSLDTITSRLQRQVSAHRPRVESQGRATRSCGEKLIAHAAASRRSLLQCPTGPIPPTIRTTSGSPHRRLCRGASPSTSRPAARAARLARPFISTIEGRKAYRSAGRTTDQVRAHHQPHGKIARDRAATDALSRADEVITSCRLLRPNAKSSGGCEIVGLSG